MAEPGRGTEDFYAVLGVDRDATPDEIRTAYRERVKETHPDQNDAPNASERFRAVKRAEEVLTDPAERARYDRLGHERYVADQAVGSTGGTEGPGNTTPGGDGGPGQGSSGSGAGAGGGGNRRDRRRGRRGGRTRDRDRGGERARDGTGGVGGAGPGPGTGNDGSGQHRRRHRNRSRRERRQHQQEHRQRANGTGAGARADQRGDRGPTMGGVDGAGPAAGGADASTDPFAAGVRRSVRFFDRRQLDIDATDAVFGFAAFFLYPIFLASSVAPSFPLPINLFLAICLFCTVGYLLATPEVGVLVFGAWTLFAPVLFLFADRPLLSWVAFFLFATTAIPLGLSLVVREVLRTP